MVWRGGGGGCWWLCLSVLLRLVAGPVTNHDSSARERRGHTTLGSVSGACCHTPPPRGTLATPSQFPRSSLAAPSRFPSGTPAACKPPSGAIIALCNKERGAGSKGRRLVPLLPYLPATSSSSTSLHPPGSL